MPAAPAPSLRLPRSVRTRLTAAFALLVAGVAGMSLLSIRTHEEVHRFRGGSAAAEQGIQHALALASDVRDLYAHQALTVLLDDRSHVPYYESARLRAAEALATTRGHVASEDDRKLLDEIEGLLAELDRNYAQRIVPVIGGDPTEYIEPHARTLALVEGISDRVSILTQRLRERATAIRRQAHEVEIASTRRLWWFLIAAVAFAAAVGIYIDRSIARPLRRLAEGADRIARGAPAVPFAVGRRDEFGFLAERLDDMAAELAARQERLIRTEKLAGIGRLAAGVAHEINNPLAVILGYGKLLARSGDERTRADAAVVLEEAMRCQEIVSGLLDLSRPPRLLLAPADLREVAREVGDRRRDAAGEGAVGLVADVPVLAHVDEGKVRQILDNLVKNAFEAAPGGRVELSCLAREGTAVIRVRDGGRGVAPEIRGRLFEPFFTTKAEGTGLGLALSAALAEAHGGSLALVDDGGPGACFELRLPLAPSESRIAS